MSVRRALLASLGFALLALTANAATFTVTNTANSGAGSLRQAILDANGAVGTDTIAFNIPGAGIHTIALASSLPSLTSPAIIDGYTQPGASANTLATGSNAVLLIEVDGVNQSLIGFDVLAGAAGSEFRGLAIGRFENAIQFNTGTGSVEGCFIGTDAAGTAPRGNANIGIAVFMQNVSIGDGTPATRNLISGNGRGIFLNNTGATVYGNYIGTNAAGTAALGNVEAGVLLSGGFINTIGGAGALGNVISGNTGVDTAGVGIAGPAHTNQIVGNMIGMDATATAPLPNSIGVFIHDTPNAPTNNTIGTLAAPNRIAFNLGSGVVLRTVTNPSTGNSIRYNSIHDNGGLGIDLGDDGETANDALDADTGPNTLQNFPVVSAAAFSAGTIDIDGGLNSTPSASFTVQFFQTPACNVSGFGEGRTFLGETIVNTDVGGAGTFNVSFAGSGSGVITATATNTAGNTSEFSFCQTVTGGPTADLAILKSAPANVAAGATFDYTLTANNAGPSDATSVTVVDTLPAGIDYVSSTPSQGSCNFAAPTLTCNLGTLANGASATVTITVTAPSIGGDVLNTASISATETDPTPANSSDSATTTVIAAAAVPIPTLNPLALAALAVLLALIGLRLR